MKFLMIILFLPMSLLCQPTEITVDATVSKGIKWSKALSWKEVLKEAKAENKYIFVDCYTTWCGPCKKMDREVYLNDSVGYYMNSRFVSVKLQMDKSSQDDSVVRKWYIIADELGRKYNVNFYPTYLFFSPDGQIVHRAGSFNPPQEFIGIAEKSLNIKQQFYALLGEYQRGIKDFSTFPYLISMATKLGLNDVEYNLRNDYLSYLATLKRKELYTKDRIAVIASAIQGTGSMFFSLFYPVGKNVNDVMEQSGYARRITDSVIARQFINPLLSKLPAGQEPNWPAMYDSIELKFDSFYAKRNLLWRKVLWADAQNNVRLTTKLFIDLVKINGLDTSDAELADGWLNMVAYNNIFGGHPFLKAGSTDTAEIDIAIDWMAGVVRRSANNSREWQSMVMDTYAMLLYKRGHKEKAITFEEKALAIATEINEESDIRDFKGKIAKMNNNEPTWKIK
ncbi:MAG: DUF255 domain-containing protein [Chitinophagaceae bacterium]|nr:DUF255 domain-containing protein [Chitinophagaceae bacterium]